MYQKLDTQLTSFDQLKIENKNMLYSYDELMKKKKKFSFSITDAPPVGKDEKSSKQPKVSIKEFLKKVTLSMKSIFETLEKVSKKQDNMLLIFSNKLKNELREENNHMSKSLKDDIKNVVEKFSLELKTKAEVNLIHKFANQLDDKMETEMSKKLDKTEIKQKTSVMNRKVNNILINFS